MEQTMDRNEERAARRAEAAARRGERDGSGPTRDVHTVARFPGATAKFALLGEVLLVGVLVTLVGILVVTLPAALAAGTRHLRRYIGAEGSSLGLFFRDVRMALPGGLAIGAGAALLAAVLALDIVIASSGLLPGGALMAVVGWVGLLALSVVLLATAGLWSPQAGWRAALRALPAASPTTCPARSTWPRPACSSASRRGRSCRSSSPRWAAPRWRSSRSPSALGTASAEPHPPQPPPTAPREGASTCCTAPTTTPTSGRRRSGTTTCASCRRRASTS
ncbi:hypothetical protein [Agromyces mangrovi Wang et al. 2018]|uniref:hypothetical protein n=1 Tax=Agromyces mangrovi TaxID=1858653 RepID=UPI00257242CF|nr:hypothetical protein [Agromyces mangrovi]